MSACIVRQEPSSGAASWLRANSSTSSHHSLARSHSPALVQATIRLQYAVPSVWTLRTCPAEAAAIASSSSTMPVSRCPALTSAPPSTLSAMTSSSRSVRSRAMSIASRAYPIWSVTDGDDPGPLDRHPAVAGAGVDVHQRSFSPGQPAARGGRPAGDRVLVGHPHRHPRGVAALPLTRIQLEGPLASRDGIGHASEEPERQPEPLVRRRRLGALQHRPETAAGLVPLRLLQRALSLVQTARLRAGRSSSGLSQAAAA